ncbi:RNA-dependent RNA polymerase 1 [Kwoniella heveanensis BCC8398]|uniref:RNA-dependent RNA polymerase n=1 Tax=Kwoniella heveanensis BCC8398 TaxID=1296120 RepID=A0A1B9GKF7_9TREE|nr:RNA-dependent RNA polymerase 1 [Kwoniella heveanensis BCC8398]
MFQLGNSFNHLSFSLGRPSQQYHVHRNPLGRSEPRPGKSANPRPSNDVSEYQFWPEAIAMGSLTYRTFTQILGAGCVKGVDPNSLDHHHKSYIAFDFKREALMIRAEMLLPPQHLPPALNPLDAELSFDDITSHGMYITRQYQGGVSTVTVTVSCRRPPKFRMIFEDSEKLRGIRDKEPYRRRATAMDFAISGVAERDAGPIKAIPEGPCAFPTFWNTYRWVFRMDNHQYNRLRACVDRIRALADNDPELDLISNISQAARWEVVKVDNAKFQELYGVPNLSQIRFSERTLIEGLIAHGILRPADIAPLLVALQQHAVAPIFQDRILETLYNQERIRNVAVVVQKTASFLRRKEPPKLSHLVLIRTVLVTPTRVLVGPPQQEPQNSVTRKYKDRIDAVIRVQFADEEDKLFAGDKVKQADNLRPDVGLMARVRRALQHGLIIGGQTYMPVASSASQQKEHAIWFINNRVIDGLQLREWMGNVAETVVAKHAARMGLPFSTTRSVDMKITIGPQLKDVERNGRTFTDGVAMAGSDVLRQAAFALGEKRGLNATPSAIQFRLGGAKGVLADWPTMCKTHEVRLRPSLIKFESKLSDLNVVRIAKYQVAFLNRQFINIMCANGVPNELMVEIFSDAVSHIKGLRERVTQGKMTKDDHSLIGVCTDFPLGQLIKAGFNNNPLVLDVAEIIECRALQDLKWRARVRLPGGVFLIGIADETGTLQEGEVFCQFQEDGNMAPRIVVNDVLICRAPACDVRRVRAVDRPELRHLKNVIVFSIRGERDLPSKLGGGDLDGDDYTLIWDQRFVRPLRVYDPMSYDAPTPKKVAKVTQADLNENFVSYILNDVLGQVDNTHLALSDACPAGPFDPQCLHLSEVHSVICLILMTHGTAGIPAELDYRIRPREWPDFMDKDDVKKTYQSQKVLGQIFRIVQPDPHFSPSDIRALNYPTDHLITRYPIHRSLIDRLKVVKAHFERAIQYDMRRYRVYEPEIPSGIAIKNKRRKRARDQNLNEPLRDAYNIHVSEARAFAMEAVANIEFKTRLTPAQLVARHAYALTYEKEYVEEWERQRSAGVWDGYGPDSDLEVGADDLRPRPLTTFAWCFAQELIQLAGMTLE